VDERLHIEAIRLFIENCKFRKALNEVFPPCLIHEYTYTPRTHMYIPKCVLRALLFLTPSLPLSPSPPPSRSLSLSPSLSPSPSFSFSRFSVSPSLFLSLSLSFSHLISLSFYSMHGQFFKTRWSRTTHRRRQSAPLLESFNRFSHVYTDMYVCNHLSHENTYMYVCVVRVCKQKILILVRVCTQKIYHRNIYGRRWAALLLNSSNTESWNVWFCFCPVLEKNSAILGKKHPVPSGNKIGMCKVTMNVGLSAGTIDSEIPCMSPTCRSVCLSSLCVKTIPHIYPYFCV